ncbi:COP1-interacting protein 7 [Andrographis paniculata]|uniref:COP1-interacting protein 7 n=1 Tax=Andrographis paniculata TaxID=175694 RepID=UPI0021E799C5|nr:COP1-interacting protein 7 [Andrographis paniculata]
MAIDSRALLDYALFQLTPTRTRCDLVIFCGKKSEKIASGLLEPFLSHLKSAKDEISKGGYSITLKPPSDNSPWFSKATLQRFVRFVSTPEVLERFVSIEREIDQIEISNDHGNASGGSHSKSKSESNGEAEENHKMHLQRVLESRKAMLKKEQAMAYARALVAGFELDELYDLVSFSDYFQALRLKEACMRFIELCNKKNSDKIWMDEVAAMQASYLGAPGTILTGESHELHPNSIPKSSTPDSITRHGSLDTSEENASAMEFNAQQTEGVIPQMAPWPQYPLYMQNARGQMFPQMPVYPGYVYPGSMPSNYPWPANFQDSDRDVENRRRYKKQGNRTRTQSKSDDESVDSRGATSPSDSSDEQEHELSLVTRERDHGKKLGRHSSKKVVIRNINYITSGGRNEDRSCTSDSDSSGEDDGALKQQVEAAVGMLKRRQQLTAERNKGRDGSKKGDRKSKNDIDDEKNSVAGERKGGDWDIFQNLLMQDSDSISNSMADTASTNIQNHEEYSARKIVEEENLPSGKFDKPKYGSDGFILTERFTGNGAEKTGVLFEGDESFRGVRRSGEDEEALAIPRRMEGECYIQNDHFGVESAVIKLSKEEDWIVGSKADVPVSSSSRTNENIFQGDRSSGNSFRHGENVRDVLLDDSFMVQSRLSDGISQHKTDILAVSDIVRVNEQEENSQGKTERSDYKEPEDLYMMLGHNPDNRSWSPEIDYGKDISLVETAGILQRTEQKDDAGAAVVRGSGNKNSIRNTKKPGPDVDRRQPKAKAPGGYLGRSKSDIPLRSKMSNNGSTATRGRAEKDEDKRKKTEELLLQRQRRIAERSAAKGVTSETTKRSSKESKKSSSVSKKTEQIKPRSPVKTERRPVMKSSTIDRLSAPRKPTETKVPNRKPTSKASSPAASTPLMKKKKGTPEKPEKAKHSRNNTIDKNGIQEKVCDDESKCAEGALHKNGTEEFGAVKVLHAVTSVEKKEPSIVSPKNASDDKKFKEFLVPSDHCVEAAPPAAGNNLKSSDMNTNEKGDERRRISFSPQVSVMDVATTPPAESEEQNHSRRKWNEGEISPKIPRGFRRLLMFGRRT